MTGAAIAPTASARASRGAGPVRPRRLRLEATSVCQLRCPACPTATGRTERALGRGRLRFEDFRDLLERSPEIVHVELSNYGELFLNRDLPRMMEHAQRRGVALTADNGANLNDVREEVLEALVRHRFRSITCSIDGATQETYARYRVGGDLETVLSNVRAINRFKRKHRSRYPKLTWQFIAFPHARHEIDAARALAATLDMTFVCKLPWNGEDEAKETGVDGEGQGGEGGSAGRHEAAPPATRREYRRRYGLSYKREICRQLWQMPQINWDGRVLGCCRNFWGDFGGHAFEQGITAAANNERMTYARGMLLGDNPPRRDVPCSTCELYLDMSRSKRWMSRWEVALPSRLLEALVERGLHRRWILVGLGAVARAVETGRTWLAAIRRRTPG